MDGKKQIQTHFGTFKEDDKAYRYDDENKWYIVTNEDQRKEFYYDYSGLLLSVGETDSTPMR